MSSTFTTKKTKKKQGFLGGVFGGDEKVWLQFVPGNVMEVLLNKESAGYVSPRDINAIIGKPHITEGIRYKSTQLKKYYPLLRGMVDVPAKGDQVLLCTFGGVNYYLGPINTINNPNFNIDHLNVADIPFKGQKNLSSAAAKKNMSKGLKITKTPRLQKPFIEVMDWASHGGVEQAIRDIPGDMVLEGRQGNSIRIGARDVNPYIMISNGRGTGNILESTTDGSIFTMFQFGKLRDYFPYDMKKTGDNEYESAPFILGSDSIDEPERMIGDDNYNYDYIRQQVLLSSKKITINAKQDSMFLSSFRNIFIGAGNQVNIISNKETIIEASNIYLGKSAEDEDEPLVLGQQLADVLNDILDIISELKVTGTIGGVSGPVDPGTTAKVKTLVSKLKNPVFFSDYHFIEPNGSK